MSGGVKSIQRVLLATAVGFILPSLAWATDARLVYKTGTGTWVDTAVASLTCGVNSSGVPQLCLTGDTSSDSVALRMGVEAATSSTDARIVYQTLTGGWAEAIPTVPVCSVDSEGVPQICNISTPDLSGYLTTTTAATTYALKTNGTLTKPTLVSPTATGISSFDSGLLTTDGNGNIILSGKNGIKFGNTMWLNYNPTYKNLTLTGNIDITGTITAPAMRGSVTGDLSASGSSLTLPVGSSGLNLVMSYSASGQGALTAVSASGSITPVDIYEVASWGTTSFKGYTLDSGTITTTATSIDDTFYLTSNAVGTYHIGVGGHLYIVDIFGSGAGKRTFMSWRIVY